MLKIWNNNCNNLEPIHYLQMVLGGSPLIARQKQIFTTYAFCKRDGYGYKKFKNFNELLEDHGDSITEISINYKQLIIQVSNHDSTFEMVVRRLTDKYEDAEYDWLYNGKHTDWDKMSDWEFYKKLFSSRVYSKGIYM